MSGKVSIKLILGMVIMLLIVVLGVLGLSTAKSYLASAAGGSEPTAVTALATGDSVKISWNTEKPTLSRVQYGTTPASMLLQSDLADETEPKTTHQVSLKNLKPGQSYYYRVKTGEDLYDNGGIPWSFKTKGGTENAKVATESGSAAEKVVVPTAAVASTSGVVPTVIPASGNTSSCVFGVDYNKDGATNVADLAYCNQNNLAANPTPTPVSSAKATCQFGVDYNKDGATNVADLAYCNQNNQ